MFVFVQVSACAFEVCVCVSQLWGKARQMQGRHRRRHAFARLTFHNQTEYPSKAHAARLCLHKYTVLSWQRTRSMVSFNQTGCLWTAHDACLCAISTCTFLSFGTEGAGTRMIRPYLRAIKHTHTHTPVRASTSATVTAAPYVL